MMNKLFILLISVMLFLIIIPFSQAACSPDCAAPPWLITTDTVCIDQNLTDTLTCAVTMNKAGVTLNITNCTVPNQQFNINNGTLWISGSSLINTIYVDGSTNGYGTLKAFGSSLSTVYCGNGNTAGIRPYCELTSSNITARLYNKYLGVTNGTNVAPTSIITALTPTTTTTGSKYAPLYGFLDMPADTTYGSTTKTERNFPVKVFYSDGSTPYPSKLIDAYNPNGLLNATATSGTDGYAYVFISFFNKTNYNGNWLLTIDGEANKNVTFNYQTDTLSPASLNLTSGTAAPGGGDTCTPPAINNDWTVNWVDNCTLTTNTDLGTGDMILNNTGSGSFTLNANLTIERRVLNPVTGAKFIILPGARLIYKK